MFFRMIKNDLKRKKMMNITLFFFVFFSSIIACLCASQIYQATYGLQNTLEATHTANYTLMAAQPMKECDVINERIAKWAASTNYITSYSHDWMIQASPKQIDFINIVEEDYPSFSRNSYYIGKLPLVHNLVIDMNNEPLTLETGMIAISNATATTCHIQVGNQLTFTTDMGNTYTFTVSTIFKDILFPLGGQNTQQRFFVSDPDFKQLLSQTPIPWNFYNFSSQQDATLTSDFLSASKGFLNSWIDLPQIIYSFIFQNILVIITLVLSIFLLIIILLTLRFTILSSIVEDIKEIGMMKAIGIPSPRFKQLYIAKYTFLSLLGCLLGLIIGIPLSYQVSSYFANNMLPPSLLTISVMGALFVASLWIIIGLFCYFSMRSIDKRSITQCLRNEESEHRKSRLFLHLIKHLSPPTYLAISDIFYNLKRYAFLICAYILGTAIMLFPNHILNSMRSESYLRYWDALSMDFTMIPDKALTDRYEAQLKPGEPSSNIHFYKWLEEDVKESAANKGIPIKIKFQNTIYCDYWINDTTPLQVACRYSDVDTREFTYYKGSAPLLANEIAVSDYMAERYQLTIGSPISLEVTCYNEDNTSTEQKKLTFFVTGTYQSMNYNGISMRFGNDFKSTIVHYAEVVKVTIDGSKDEKAAVLQNLKQVYGDDVFITPTEYLEYMLSDFMTLFENISLFINISVLSILFLMTLLYTHLMMSKELTSIAILKQLGISNGTLRNWQLIRMLLLTVFSTVIGTILSITLGELLASICFYKLVGITHFTLHPNLLSALLITPALLITIISLGVYICCRKINHITVHTLHQN